ncbi:MAG: ion transporter [Thermoanaerobaculia bacterium]|nr:ion transporter [Thermoanaerobaculia bacterium]
MELRDARREHRRGEEPPRTSGWRHSFYEVIFEAETPGGKAFDVALLVLILVSVIAVLLESVAGIRALYGRPLLILEWGITILFTIEYLLRLIVVRRPWQYATSFFGLVDLLAILPTYLSVLVAGAQSLLVIRALRLLRVFRILKMAHFLGEARVLKTALAASARKITVFLFTVLTMVLLIGATMYLIEGEDSGFTSIPQSMYWAIVTMTTVGYGDVAPQTVPGKMLASLVMIVGYGIIAVPTGIVTVEMSEAFRRRVTAEACPACGREGHDPDAQYCKHCGGEL